MSRLRWMMRHKKICLALAATLFMLWFIPPVWMLHMGVVTVTQWTKKHGERTAKVGPKHPGWISSKRVSKHVFHAMVTAEDARFYQHHGLDVAEIIKSAEQNRRKGRYTRGASTITQQVVKMAFLTRQKSLVRKAREAIGATILELIMDKTSILEWYINLAEFGDGVYGIKSAAAHYFQTKPELLTIPQSVHLALVLPAPNSWSFGLRRHNLTSFGERRYSAIVTGMRKSGYITETQWLQALASGNFGSPVPAYESALARHNAKNPPTETSDTISTPDSALERELMSTDAKAIEPGPEETKLEEEEDRSNTAPTIPTPSASGTNDG